MEFLTCLLYFSLQMPTFNLHIFIYLFYLNMHVETTAFISFDFTFECKFKQRLLSICILDCFFTQEEVNCNPANFSSTSALHWLSLLNLDHPSGVSSYTGGSKTEPHEEVEGGAGLAPGDVHAAAAMVQHTLTQVCTLLHLLLEQQVAELGET